MEVTTDKAERLRRIVMAVSILQWYVCQELGEPVNDAKTK